MRIIKASRVNRKNIPKDGFIFFTSYEINARADMWEFACLAKSIKLDETEVVLDIKGYIAYIGSYVGDLEEDISTNLISRISDVVLHGNPESSSSVPLYTVNKIIIGDNNLKKELIKKLFGVET